MLVADLVSVKENIEKAANKKESTTVVRTIRPQEDNHIPFLPKTTVQDTIDTYVKEHLMIGEDPIVANYNNKKEEIEQTCKDCWYYQWQARDRHTGVDFCLAATSEILDTTLMRLNCADFSTNGK